MEHWKIFEQVANSNLESIAITSQDKQYSYRQLVQRCDEQLSLQGWDRLQRGARLLVKDSVLSAVDVVISILTAWRLGLVVLVLPEKLDLPSEEQLVNLVKPSAVWDPVSLKMKEFINDQSVRVPEGCMMFLTSGTTGEPKVVVHQSKSLLMALQATIAVQESTIHGDKSIAMDAHHDDIATQLPRSGLGMRFMTCMPLSTIAGFTLLQRTLFTGDHLFIPHDLSVSSIFRSIADQNVNSVAATPFIAQNLVREQLMAPIDLGSLLTVGIGGGRVTEDTVIRVEQTLQCVAIVGYGSTETAGPVIASCPTDPLDLRASKTGKALSHATCRISDRGELEVSCTSLMLGYLSADGSIDRINDGWFRTGDYASIDGQGYVSINGRLSDRIIRGGKNIDPHEIEAVINDHPLVDRSAVVGRPSRVPGEEDVIAFVIPRDGEALELHSLRRWCLSRLEPRLVPRVFRGCSQLPLASDGGVNRRAVRQMVDAEEA